MIEADDRNLDSESDAVPLPMASGKHGPIAQRYRAAAITQLQILRIMVAGMEGALRTRPDDDALFEERASEFQSARVVAGQLLDCFRVTRDCEGQG